jgi:Spy/CpxP family protein refolding chaperone
MPPGPPPPDPILGPAGRLLHEIGLTRAQDKQLRDVVGKAIDAGLGQAARGFMEARHALEVLVWNAASSDQDMISAEQTLSDRTRDLEQARKHLAADILAVLTEDQRAEFLERLGEDPKPPMGPPPSRR